MWMLIAHELEFVCVCVRHRRDRVQLIRERKSRLPFARRYVLLTQQQQQQEEEVAICE